MRHVRIAAPVCFMLGFTGLAYWVPALFGVPQHTAQEHSMAIIQQVLSMAEQQYIPQMRFVGPTLGGLFTLASLLQIPSAVGTFLRREGAMRLLRGIAYCKVALYIASGLLLGLAIFSSPAAGRPWTVAVENWLANLAMIAFYYWVVVAVNQALSHRSTDEEVLGLEDASEEAAEETYSESRAAGV